MSKRESIARYNLIIKKLRKYPANFDDIFNYLEKESEIQSYNFTISKRTFQRDLDDIRSLFNIDILFDFSKKVYYIDNAGESVTSERMLEAFDTFNALHVADGLTQYIHFENRRPKGTENLYGLLHAIKNRLQIKFTYYIFWSEEISERTVSPYILKEFKNRWYVMAKDQKDGNIKSFALDRLTELEILKKKVEQKEAINWEEKFRYSFGIIDTVDEEPQEIILSFDAYQGKYIKSLPIHETQKIIKDNESELQIKLKLYVTHDLIMEILSYGDGVKVLKPKTLVKAIQEQHKNAYKSYGDK